MLLLLCRYKCSNCVIGYHVAGHTCSNLAVFISFVDIMQDCMCVMHWGQLAALLHSAGELKCAIGLLPCQSNCSLHSIIYSCVARVQKTLQAIISELKDVSF